MIARLLAGKKIDMPPIRQVGTTFRKAEGHRPKGGEQPGLYGKSGSDQGDDS